MKLTNSAVICVLIFVLQSALKCETAEKKYFIPSIRANWFKANEFCNSLKMRLAVVKSKAENDAIARHVRTTDKFSDENCSFWIGATDLAEEGTFIWTATGERVTYSNWRRGEPNSENTSENCVQLAYIPWFEYNWNWNDNSCSGQSFYFVCESVECDCVQEF